MSLRSALLPVVVATLLASAPMAGAKSIRTLPPGSKPAPNPAAVALAAPILYPGRSGVAGPPTFGKPAPNATPQQPRPFGANFPPSPQSVCQRPMPTGPTANGTIPFSALVHPACVAQPGAPTAGPQGPVVIVQPQPFPVPFPQAPGVAPAPTANFAALVANAHNAATAGVNSGVAVAPDVSAMSARRNDAAHDAQLTQQARSVAALLQARRQQTARARPRPAPAHPFQKGLGTWVGDACGVTQLALSPTEDGVVAEGIVEAGPTRFQLSSGAAVAYGVTLDDESQVDLAMIREGEGLRFVAGRDNQVVCQGVLQRPGKKLAGM